MVDLLYAIREVSRVGPYVSPEVSQAVGDAAKASESRRCRAAEPAGTPRRSNRCEGESSKQIAELLKLSVKTAELLRRKVEGSDIHHRALNHCILDHPYRSRQALESPTAVGARAFARFTITDALWRSASDRFRQIPDRTGARDQRGRVGGARASERPAAGRIPCSPGGERRRGSRTGADRPPRPDLDCHPPT